MCANGTEDRRVAPGEEAGDDLALQSDLEMPRGLDRRRPIAPGNPFELDLAVEAERLRRHEQLILEAGFETAASTSRHQPALAQDVELEPPREDAVALGMQVQPIVPQRERVLRRRRPHGERALDHGLDLAHEVGIGLVEQREGDVDVGGARHGGEPESGDDQGRKANPCHG
jgi:hypothetical protein